MVPASAAMKWGSWAMASSRLSACMPPPTAPIAAMNLISSTLTSLSHGLLALETSGTAAHLICTTSHANASFLPYDLGSQLDLARRSVGGSDSPGTPSYAVKSSDSIELQAIDGRLKVCVVQNIEEFKTQLQAKRF